MLERTLKPYCQPLYFDDFGQHNLAPGSQLHVSHDMAILLHDWRQQASAPLSPRQGRIESPRITAA